MHTDSIVINNCFLMCKISAMIHAFKILQISSHIEMTLKYCSFHCYELIKVIIDTESLMLSTVEGRNLSTFLAI